MGGRTQIGAPVPVQIGHEKVAVSSLLGEEEALGDPADSLLLLPVPEPSPVHRAGDDVEPAVAVPVDGRGVPEASRGDGTRHAVEISLSEPLPDEDARIPSGGYLIENAVSVQIHDVDAPEIPLGQNVGFSPSGAFFLPQPDADPPAGSFAGGDEIDNAVLVDVVGAHAVKSAARFRGGRRLPFFRTEVHPDAQTSFWARSSFGGDEIRPAVEVQIHRMNIVEKLAFSGPGRAAEFQVSQVLPNVDAAGAVSPVGDDDVESCVGVDVGQIDGADLRARGQGVGLAPARFPEAGPNDKIARKQVGRKKFGDAVPVEIARGEGAEIPGLDRPLGGEPHAFSLLLGSRGDSRIEKVKGGRFFTAESHPGQGQQKYEMKSPVSKSHGSSSFREKAVTSICSMPLSPILQDIFGCNQLKFMMIQVLNLVRPGLDCMNGPGGRRKLRVGGR